MNLMKKRWALLALACLINLCAGSIYTWSVLAPPIAERLSLLTGETVTAGGIAAAFGLANGIAPIPMILGGAVNDRFGPRLVIAFGGLLIGAGYAAAGLVTTPLALILGFGLLFGLGLGFVYGPTVNATLKFFPDRPGLAGGLATAFYGLSSVLLPPIALALTDAQGVSRALVTLGGLFALVIVPGGLLMMKCPEGFIASFRGPDGAKTPQRASFDWRGMLRSKRFPPMVGMLLAGAIPGMMLLSHGWSLSRELAGLDAAAASAMVSALALANVAGRLVAGAASDRFGRVASLSAALAATVAGCALLFLASPSAPLTFWCGMTLVGVSFGAFMGIYPGFTAGEFGARHNSVNYGIMFFGFSAAGFIGPVAMNALLAGGLSPQSVCLAAGAFPLAGLACARLFCLARASGR